MQNEDADILLSSQSVNGSRSSISRSGSNDSQMMSLLTLLDVLVLPGQEVLEEVSDELQSNILEGEGRTVEELEKVDVLFWDQWDDWGDFWMAEGAVGLVDEGLEIGIWDFGRRDEETVDIEGELLEGEFAPFGFPILWKAWNSFGDKETSISSETLEDGGFEGELSRNEVSFDHQTAATKREGAATCLNRSSTGRAVALR